MSIDKNIQVHSRLISLPQGIYAFTYHTEMAELPIPITLHKAPMGEADVEFLASASVKENTLRFLGDQLVVGVKNQDAVLIATTYVPSSVEPATILPKLQVKRIDPTSQALEQAQTDAQPKNTVRALPLLAKGHIQNQGDVISEQGMLGNPQVNARIEGFVLEWPNKPNDVELFYTCTSGLNSHNQPQPSGQFVGTKGKAAPITSLTFWIQGKGAERYQLAGKVVFAGGKVLPIETGKALTGPSGSEPLISMQIGVLDKSPTSNASTDQEGEHENVKATPVMPSTTQVADSWEDARVTTVFKAEGKAAKTSP